MGIFDIFLSPEQRLMNEQVRLVASPLINSPTAQARRGSALTPEGQQQMRDLEQRAIEANLIDAQRPRPPILPEGVGLLANNLKTAVTQYPGAVGRTLLNMATAPFNLGTTLMSPTPGGPNAAVQPPTATPDIPASGLLAPSTPKIPDVLLSPQPLQSQAEQPALQQAAPEPMPIEPIAPPVPRAQPTFTPEQNQAAIESVNNAIRQGGTRNSADEQEQPQGFLDRLQNLKPANLGLIAFGLSMMAGSDPEDAVQIGLNLYQAAKEGEITSAQREAVASMIQAQGITGAMADAYLKMEPGVALGEITRVAGIKDEREYDRLVAQEDRQARIEDTIRLENIRFNNSLAQLEAQAEASGESLLGVDKTFLRDRRQKADERIIALDKMMSQYDEVRPDLLATVGGEYRDSAAVVARRTGQTVDQVQAERAAFQADNRAMVLAAILAFTGKQANESEREGIQLSMPTFQNYDAESFKSIALRKAEDLIVLLEQDYSYLGEMPQELLDLRQKVQTERAKINARLSGEAQFSDGEVDALTASIPEGEF